MYIPESSKGLKNLGPFKKDRLGVEIWHPKGSVYPHPNCRIARDPLLRLLEK